MERSEIITEAYYQAFGTEQGYGAWTYEQVVEYAEQAEQELNAIYQTCNVLPNTTDRQKLDRLCIELVEKSLSRWSGYNIRKSFSRLMKG